MSIDCPLRMRDVGFLLAGISRSYCRRSRAVPVQLWIGFRQAACEESHASEQATIEGVVVLPETQQENLSRNAYFIVTGVHTRQSIYEALRKKEMFATSGPRTELRFFAGYQPVHKRDHGGAQLDQASALWRDRYGR